MSHAPNPLAAHDPQELGASLRWLIAQGLIEPKALTANAEPNPHTRVRLTLHSRLLGDAVTRELLPEIDHST